MSQSPSPDYEFTNRWFDGPRSIWDDLLPKLKPERILEIGSFEGASACYLMETVGARNAFELHCIDTWEGGVEHQPGGRYEDVMGDVERRFRSNTELARSRALNPVSLHVHKSASAQALIGLLAEGRSEAFDFIYVDGSHQAPDVLTDAILAFKLLRVGGVIAFDDYLWSERLPGGVDPIRCPKIAIDAFMNIFCRKMTVMPGALYQLYARKVAG